MSEALQQVPEPYRSLFDQARRYHAQGYKPDNERAGFITRNLSEGVDQSLHVDNREWIFLYAIQLGADSTDTRTEKQAALSFFEKLIAKVL